MSEIIRQTNWSEDKLRAAGFRFYERRKQLIMARELPAAEAPLTIQLPLEKVTVEAGYIIVFEPGQTVRANLYDYPHWPVRPDMFQETYTAWDEPDWTLSAPERDLMARGCKPYFKHAGVWARKLAEPTYTQTVESAAPVLIPAGMWLLIGAMNEPYNQPDEMFRKKYIVSDG